MGLRDVKMGAIALFGMAIFSFGIVGCGGGGVDVGATPPAESDRVAIDAANSDAVAATAYQALDVGDIAGGLNPLGKSFKILSDEEPKLKSILAATISLKDMAVDPYADFCDSGTISMSGTQTSATMTFNNCVLGNSSLNGSMILTINSTGTEGTLTFANFTTTMNGEIIASYESLSYIYKFNSSMTEITSMTLAINGYILDGDKRMDFINYKLDMSMSDNVYTISINGYVKENSLNAWIGITTVEAIKIDDSLGNYNYCPIAGKITIGGNGSSMTMTYNNDGSVDVSIDGGVPVHHGTCEWFR